MLPLPGTGFSGAAPYIRIDSNWGGVPVVTNAASASDIPSLQPVTKVEIAANMTPAEARRRLDVA
ncbi:hypothetical protein ADM96_01190 [Burkholderia sp. ST111]|nr:hypothetical protein ADM96_01190 [Burkholderia sp. ST111]